MSKLGFGIMGPGYIASKFTEALGISDGAFLAAVSSKSIERARDFAARYGAESCYDDYDAMCKNHSVDVVYISTTNNYHYENMITCISNGKHIICEKPMTVTMRQAEDVFEKAEKNGVFVMEALWSRFLPSIVKAAELINYGAIGKVCHIVSSFNFPMPYEPERRIFNRRLGGGVLLDLGVYCISLSMLFIGERPEEAFGYAGICPQQTDIDDNVLVRFPSGKTASFICGLKAGKPHEMFIMGDKGNIRLNHRFLDTRKVELLHEENVVETYDFNFKNGFEYQIGEAIKCIRGKWLQSGIMSWQDTLDCARITEKLMLDWGIAY
jgi:predicted dehydrogenase